MLVETTSVTVLLCHYNKALEDTNAAPEDPAQHFGNLCVHKPSTLQEKPFQFAAQLRRKCTFEKCSKCRRHFFWRVQ